jgi:hypothetical protein
LPTHPPPKLPNTTSRAIGNAIGDVNSGSAPTNQRLDVILNSAAEGAQNFTVSFYFCDWDAPGTPTAHSVLNQARINGVQVFDLFTRQQVIPIVKIDQYQNGLWISVRYSRSVRLRILDVAGDGPTLSAIMFDP